MKLAANSFILLVTVMLSFSSCVSRRKIAYLQGEGEQNLDLENNVKIKPDDVLTIRVSTEEPDAAIPFNLIKSAGQTGIPGNIELETYLVSHEGNIIFPVVGEIKVTNLTNIELAERIKTKISDYVKDAIVNVRILNFKISVLGEVNSPGTFVIEDDHITLPQALGLAGDMTIYGKRKNVLVARQIKGKQVRKYVDLRDADVVSSPYYYLQQNDIVYVEPVGARRQSASFLGTASSYLSLASVIISTIVLITNN
ncbi:polysaccharide biosynthesis/export family protein [Zunongwangia sp. HRR-M8]|uniref:polysaccharide biosynthesis/export family protein n=1 Tax=Zunongwangia sp. HRR-M8 TaxID=3015170 RepID=UPI0022DD6AED|nr:polysaccharide biosynthesis/export family protein [Zunongwangia sp. HRR-M8]WBL21649.1 polysaccharide biosynthesis/export family protein [Zunongwangia sp. HRR-M8]